MSEAKPFSFLSPIKNPPAYVMDPEKKHLEITLDVEYDTNNVFSFEKPHNVPTYTRVFTSDLTKEAGNTLTGPTIEVRPGSKLQIHTHNKLPEQDQTEPDDINFPYGFNNYNIHTHGLHVTPESPGDNVCMTIRPGEAYDYEYDIPADHPPGVYWYHPHKHGSVALQVGSGMAGMIIVRGAFDDQLKEMGVKEYCMVFQNIAVNAEGKVEDQKQVAKFPNSEYNITVNSQYCPIIKVKPGELINLRLLNATTRSSINFECPFFGQMFIYGYDGNPTDNYRRQGGISLAPANRASILLKISEAATPGAFYYVQNDSVEYQFIPHYKYHNNPPLFAIEVERGEEIGAAIYMPSETAERTTPPPFPESLRGGLLEPIGPEEVTNKRTLTFQANTLDNPDKYYRGVNVTIDHGQFGGCEVVNHWVELDAVEEWTLENESEFPHPIHIHVNPMYVFEIQGEDPLDYTLELPFWADTIQVPPHGHVKFRMRFKDFVGKYPLHCHLLYHEDGGMMQHVKVVRDLKEKDDWNNNQ
ncbi:Multicopper oxidase mco [Pseudovibrio sp. W64]|uniref:multicopper oxidase family protein n=1 Tax=unclassified Pseudovibrio TaxID=2627060 RepID=UPI0007AEBF24|nr:MULTISPECIES: multicopper oxidase domain-containing protein [unclassified Pseudovibrio]KZK78446.1 Multicopper oxidase mco [Pseudovibrio sp. W64]